MALAHQQARAMALSCQLGVAVTVLYFDLTVRLGGRQLLEQLCQVFVHHGIFLLLGYTPVATWSVLEAIRVGLTQSLGRQSGSALIQRSAFIRVIVISIS